MPYKAEVLLVNRSLTQKLDYQLVPDKVALLAKGQVGRMGMLLELAQSHLGVGSQMTVAHSCSVTLGWCTSYILAWLH